MSNSKEDEIDVDMEDLCSNLIQFNQKRIIKFAIIHINDINSNLPLSEEAQKLINSIIEDITILKQEEKEELLWELGEI